MHTEFILGENPPKGSKTVMLTLWVIPMFRGTYSFILCLKTLLHADCFMSLGRLSHISGDLDMKLLETVSEFI